MKCIICDTLLNDEEAKRKDLSGRYLDTCDECQGVVEKSQDQWDFIEDLKLTVDSQEET